jgi:type I restriction enzyme S subunit
LIAELKPYAEYTDSGLPWLGQVPAHWQIVRSKRLFAARKDLAQPDDPQLSATQAYGVIEQAEFERRSGHRVVKISMHLDKRKHVEKDDFVISMRSFQGGIERAWSSGAIRSSYVVLRPGPDVNAGFFQYVLKSPGYIRALQATGDFIRDGQDLSFANFVRVDLPLVPIDEQAAIAMFLDWANGRLERTIRAKRKVIALLMEQKQAIVQGAVTKGLDRQAPLKASSISWLGGIPQHWGVISLRMRYSVELGKMLDAKRITGRNSIPYLRNRDVQWDRVLVDDLPMMDITPAEFARYTVKHGDLLVCEGGQVGRCAFWDEALPMCGFQKALHRVRAMDHNRDYPRFFFYQLQLAAGLGVFTADGNENTIAHLTNEKLRRHRFAFPPIDEQQSIADSLDAELEGVKQVIDRLKREILLLREYRTRLVADVVTGKLDVREAAASLPDEVAPSTEAEPADEADDPELTDEEAEA